MPPTRKDIPSKRGRVRGPPRRTRNGAPGAPKLLWPDDVKDGKRTYASDLLDPIQDLELDVVLDDELSDPEWAKTKYKYKYKKKKQKK